MEPNTKAKRLGFSDEPSNEPSDDTADDTDEVPPEVCEPGSGDLIQSGNLPVQIVGSPIDSEPRSDFAGWDIAICDLDNDGFDDLGLDTPRARCTR